MCVKVSRRSKPQKGVFLMPSEQQQRPNRLKRARLFKAYTPFLPEELDKIERWGLTNLIRNRGDAVRILVRKGLEADNASRDAR
jgi:hypothetical protein